MSNTNKTPEEKVQGIEARFAGMSDFFSQLLFLGKSLSKQEKFSIQGIKNISNMKLQLQEALRKCKSVVRDEDMFRVNYRQFLGKEKEFHAKFVHEYQKVANDIREKLKNEFRKFPPLARKQLVTMGIIEDVDNAETELIIPQKTLAKKQSYKSQKTKKVKVQKKTPPMKPFSTSEKQDMESTIKVVKNLLKHYSIDNFDEENAERLFKALKTQYEKSNFQEARMVLLEIKGLQHELAEFLQDEKNQKIERILELKKLFYTKCTSHITGLIKDIEVRCCERNRKFPAALQNIKNQLKVIQANKGRFDNEAFVKNVKRLTKDILQSNLSISDEIFDIFQDIKTL